MAQRLRLYDMRLTRLPTVVGKCQGDIADIAKYLNAAQERLLLCREAGEEGWWGTWAEMRFNVSQSVPFVTLPREVARIEVAAICNHPVPIRNQFYDYLQFGNGRMPNAFIQTIVAPGTVTPFTFSSCFSTIDIRSRNNAPTFADLSNPPQNIVLFPGDPTDGQGQARVLLQGLDPAGNTIYTTDGLNRVLGQFVTLKNPFATAPIPMSKITGVQKDITIAPVQVFQSDPNTGAQILLLTMEPSEQTAWYRRYFFNQLPLDCCNGAVPSVCNPTLPAVNLVQITAIAKLELIPVAVDTDYCLIQNKEALISEAQAVRYSEMDVPNKAQLMADHHTQAVRYLNGELTHYLGLNEPAVNFQPFGSAHLRRQRIGQLI